MPQPITVVQHVLSGQDTVSDTSLDIAYANIPTPGNKLIAAIRTSSGENVTGVTDTVNQWTIRAPIAAGDQLWIADCDVAGDMTGKTLSVALSANDSDKGVYVFEVTPCQFGERFSAGVFFAGTIRGSGGPTVRPDRVGSLVFGFWADSSQETALTPAAGYTLLPTATAPGYFTTATIFIEGVYKIAQSIANEQPTATGGGSPVAYSAYEAWYRPIPDPFRPGRMPLGV